ncbi:aspartic proteinase nepenthesin-1-like [Lolium perenne]|uniref:aspartic proteinase nepenthesin-1-like n=1 Tax=Lolium perenne TaxID=4522 RepID=UPI0021F6039D|nr:aspartic proteinase nepenthesin-1-like [Lolium perenne]
MRKEMTTSSIFLLLLCATTSLATCCSCFRIELNHVDSKANLTAAEHFRRAGSRAQLRLESLVVTAPLTLGDGDYIAQFTIGSLKVHAMVDTMTNLVWTQCKTCRPHCFQQELDFYDLSMSTTGEAVYCNDSLCAAGYETQPCTGHHGRAGACAVRTTSDFAVDIAGVLLTEEFTFGSTEAKIAFGCITETNNVMGLHLHGASGVLGLGKGALSLVSQVGGNRFSYCLTRDHVQSSSLFVGPSAGLHGDAPFESAPLSLNPPINEPFHSYYLPLATVTVGEPDLDDIPFEALNLQGGLIIDISYPFMLLVDVAYQEVRQVMSRKLGSSLVPSPVDWLELCVAHSDVRRLVPPLELHFGDGTRGGHWTIPPENYWTPVDISTSCMVVLNSALMASPLNKTSIIGNYMQQDMHILYDLDNQEVSFQPADCSSI